MIIENTKNIASLIREERKRQGLTQEQLAGLCNTSTRFIFAIENDKETAQIGKVIKVVNMLGLNINIE